MNKPSRFTVKRPIKFKEDYNRIMYDYNHNTAKGDYVNIDFINYQLARMYRIIEKGDTILINNFKNMPLISEYPNPSPEFIDFYNEKLDENENALYTKKELDKFYFGHKRDREIYKSYPKAKFTERGTRADYVADDPELLEQISKRNEIKEQVIKNNNKIINFNYILSLNDIEVPKETKDKIKIKLNKLILENEQLIKRFKQRGGKSHKKRKPHTKRRYSRR
jgi:hypothetical protein